MDNKTIIQTKSTIKILEEWERSGSDQVLVFCSYKGPEVFLTIETLDKKKTGRHFLILTNDVWIEIMYWLE